ncbi:MAG: type II toxin-antitoxin system VapC family toxin [Thermoguttaceae bacterium]
MGLIDELRGHSVFFDTAPIVYYVEDKSPYADLLEPVFHAVQMRHVEAYTSTVTFAETLVMPYRSGNKSLVAAFEHLFSPAAHMTVLPLDFAVARETARLRAVLSSLRTPDAIQLATANVHRIDFFLTNDRRLHNATGSRILCLNDFIE